MMIKNSIILFKINGALLRREVNLVIGVESPLLFICNDEMGNRYICFDINEEGTEFFIIPITSNKLVKLLYGEINTRSLFSESSSTSPIYHIRTIDSDIDHDIVTKMEFQEIDKDDLPAEESRLDMSLHIPDSNVLESYKKSRPLFNNDINDNLLKKLLKNWVDW